MYEVGVRATGRPRCRCGGAVATELNIGYVGMGCRDLAYVVFRWRTDVGARCWWRTRLKNCAGSWEGRGFISRWCHWNFSLT